MEKEITAPRVGAEKEMKIQTGLRIPENKYNEINTMATQMGVSVNTLILMLVDIGLNVIRLGTEEAHRVLLRNQQDIS